MAAVNGKKLKRMLKLLTKDLGREPTFEEFRDVIRGEKINA